MYKNLILPLSILIVILYLFYPKEYFSDKEIRLGMIAPFSGDKKYLGEDMLFGAKALFEEINHRGGIYGRFIKIVFKDDKYEPKIAAENAFRLINDENIFAFFGVVGTPSSKTVSAIAENQNIPFIGAFCGADFLRKKHNPFVLNSQTSYENEMESLVKYFVDEKKLTRIAIFYQNDSYGRSGLKALKKALDKRNLKIVGEGSYKRNTLSVGNALYELSLTRPEAIILVSTSIPAAEFIKRARKNRKIIEKIYFGALSFISPKILVKNLDYKADNIVFSQVVPSPWHSRMEDVIEYRELFSKYFPGKEFGYISLKGFLSAKIVVELLKRAGGKFTYEDFITVMRKFREDMEGVSKKGYRYKKYEWLYDVYLNIYKNGDFVTLKSKDRE